MKRCPRCGVTKALDDFHRNRSRPDGHADRCKPCAIAAVKKAPSQQPEARRVLEQSPDRVAYKREHRQRLEAGWTPEQWEEHRRKARERYARRMSKR